MSIAVVNLISPARASRVRTRMLARRWATGLGFYTLLLGTLGLVLTGTASRQQELREAVLLFEAKAESRKQELASDRRRAEDLRKALRAAQAVGMHADWGRMLTIIAAEAGDTITIDKLDVKVEQEQPRVVGTSAAGSAARPGSRERTPSRHARVLISGIGADLASVQSMTVRLEEIGVFDQVRIQETSAMEARGQTWTLVKFQIVCTMRETVDRGAGDKR